MVGGLLLSQMLTLFTTPVVYLYLDRWSGRMRRRREERRRAKKATLVPVRDAEAA
jgi:multidrug efflux pump